MDGIAATLMNQQRFDSLLHHHIITTFIQEGHAPTNAQLARMVDTSVEDVEEGLLRLQASHAVVLHPGRCELWVAHPFSLSPTHTWVQTSKRGWWAPCMGCALGIAALVTGRVTVHARIGGEAEPVKVNVVDGVPIQTELFVHWPEPPRMNWNNVHYFCSRLLPFRSPEDVVDWTRRHQLPLGEIMPITQLAEFSRRWYGHHANKDWEKWTLTQATEIFSSTGLKGEFWRLGNTGERF